MKNFADISKNNKFQYRVRKEIKLIISAHNEMLAIRNSEQINYSNLRGHVPGEFGLGHLPSASGESVADVGILTREDLSAR